MTSGRVTPVHHVMIMVNSATVGLGVVGLALISPRILMDGGAGYAPDPDLDLGYDADPRASRVAGDSTGPGRLLLCLVGQADASQDAYVISR
jgi:hypothetical protein